MTNPKQALKMAYRVSTIIKAPNWHAEHKARQYRLINAIDADIITPETAEIFDAFDNFLRLTWINASPICLLSSN
jgi:hypothetical protein